MRRFAAGLIALWAGLAAAAAHAQEFPSKPIRIVVPWAPGGNVDITARTIAPGLGEALGTSVVVENKPGAGGTLGTVQVAKAAPDGYTLTLGSTAAVTIAPSVFKDSGYDPVKDLTALGAIHNSPLVLTVAQKVAAKSFPDYVELAKARGGQMPVGTPGIASTNHLTMELVSRIAGFKYVHVPYKGAGPALQDLVSGQLESMVDQIPPSIPHIKEGRIRALAVSALKRMAALPDVPTFDEVGLKGFQASTFTGLFGPAGMPPAVVEKLAAALQKTVSNPAVREKFAATGVEMLDMKREEFTAFVKQDFEKWRKVVEDAKITAE